MSGSAPAVGIIITVHNDQANLVGSVASATTQSLRDLEILIVDDCSDDGSYDVAVDLASRDPRISVYATQRNSGAAGCPRNVGLQAATAPWVTFMDSDDALDELACERMVEAAEQDHADVVCGQTERHFLDSREVVAWHRELFGVRRHLTSITEYLDLVLETSIGKLYRRTFLAEHGLTFREGVFYEDLIFSAQVYSKAESISVVPERVYIWNVYPADVRRSVTNRRAEEVNLRHRIEANRAIQQIAADSGREGLLERYQLKFLEHDARLYLKDLVYLDDDQAQRVVAALDPELRRIPERVYSRLGVHDRLLYGLALLGSVDGVREIKPAVKGHVLLEGSTTQSDGRVAWRPSAPLGREPELGSLEERLLDLTGDEILETPFSEIAYAHRVSAIDLETAERALVRGVTTDPLRKFPPMAEGVEATILGRLQGSDFEFSLPTTVHAAGNQRFEWEFRAEMPAKMPWVRPLQFELWVRIDAGGDVNTSAVWLRKGAEAPKLEARRGTLRSLLREKFIFRRIGAGRLTLTLADPSGRRGRIDAMVHRFLGGS